VSESGTEITAETHTTADTAPVDDPQDVGGPSASDGEEAASSEAESPVPAAPAEAERSGVGDDPRESREPDAAPSPNTDGDEVAPTPASEITSL
jgi:hypothetical protein